MADEKEIEQLKQDLFSNDWELMKNSSEALRDIGGEDIFSFFVRLLDTGSSTTRNVAALRLKEIGDNRAVDALFKAILKKENINYNGTLVYALWDLDCSHKLREVFEILFYHGYEAKEMACKILDDQVFEFTKGDVLYIKTQWDDLKLHPGRNPVQEYTAEIQRAVDAFLPYLNEVD